MLIARAGLAVQRLGTAVELERASHASTLR
jgi:hypothetical protein